MSYRVAIVTSNFWPEPTGISQVAWEFARYLAGRGLDVRVATAMPYYPEWRIWRSYRRSLWMSETREGVHIYRSWHAVSPDPSPVTRILHETSLALFSIPTLLRTLAGAQVVVIFSPALTFAFQASLLATVLDVRRLLYIQDVMPDAALELGLLRSSLLVRLARLLASGMYRMADVILTLSHGMRARIAGLVQDPGKIRVLPNTFDPDELEPVCPDENLFRQRFVPDGKFAVVHMGNMGQKQDLDVILRAAERLVVDPSVHFYVFGDGARKAAFLTELERRRLNNVTHAPLQERSMVPHMLSGADVLLVTQVRQITDIVVPSKLITALGAGAMIVSACAADSETARVLVESGGGMVVEAGDDSKLAEAILRVKAGSVDCAAIRKRAREFAVRQFTREAVYGPLVDELLKHGQLSVGRR